MIPERLSIGMHPMTIFGDEFDDGSFCWMEDNNEIWLSLIIVKKEHRRKGVLHHLLEDAKKVSDRVVIPEPSRIVADTAAKHEYTPAEYWIDDYDEYIDVMEWARNGTSCRHATL